MERLFLRNDRETKEILTMKEKQFGFGIIGAGVISNIHAMAISAIDNARLIGVYSINKSKSNAFADKNNCTAYNTLDEMLNVSEIDIVCICTPSGIHLEPAIKCIEAGKHCLIEKPLEVTLEKCDRIIDAAYKAGVKIGVIFPSRFYEASKQIKKSIDEKRFGDLVLGDAYVKWHRSPEYYKSSAWRGTWEFDGGGALMNQGIHSVDLLQWYMGSVESVQSVTANIRHKEIEVEDTVVSTLKFTNGALGTIECSTAVFPGALKRIEIMGTAGTAILEESGLTKWQFEKKTSEDEMIMNSMLGASISHGGVSNPADISFTGHQRQIEDMLHSLKTGDKPLVDGIEGRKSVEIVLAIYESARTGKMVRLPTFK
ncbi:Gfo/Idh/MocA family protein [Segetibacter koreensis]|uniref:Gfo/Idh/MocA family protein n=1 Tax=Segetibacter koreensis TaxID=398037 RepID=UPI00036D61F3|nr:Gfo/Idh/MocA family oxidoreductase [Segetibacter koreensis]